MEIHGGIYGLPQAGRLVHEDLIKHLKLYGYSPVTHTPDLWKHKTNGITFILIVDDFGIKYQSEEALDHLIAVLKEKYTITIDKSGSVYIDVTL